MNQKNLKIYTDKNNTDEYIEKMRDYTDSLHRSRGKAPMVYVQTFGCQQNEADSERLAGMAVEMGYEYTSDPDKADLILFNTCAVREHAELKALSLTGQLKHKKAKNPDLIVGICGCMVAQEHRLNEIKNKYPYVDFLFGATSPQRFPEFLYNAVSAKKRAFYPDDDHPVITEGLSVRRDSKFKAWVSVMYGCNNFCSYCVVPYVRGRERSRKKEDILKEIQSLADSGYREITLLGQNVNSYGKDIYDSYDFADLLEDICRIRGDYWIRFMTSHPKDASHKLIDTIAAHCGDDAKPKIVRQFHLPVQSGSDSILDSMRRKYTSSYYLELVNYIKEKIPGISLSTDIIVGFPGETDEDFVNTIEMLRKVRYDALYSFVFSPRKGTPAADMSNQIPDAVKKKRFADMLEVQNGILIEENKKYVGKTVKVLVEERSKTNPEKLTGRNEQNRLVHFSGDDALIGTFVNLKIISADTYFLVGETIG